MINSTKKVRQIKSINSDHIIFDAVRDRNSEGLKANGLLKLLKKINNNFSAIR
ncbi:MAG: hypothetical protein ABIC82_01560 [bacterium]